MKITIFRIAAQDDLESVSQQLTAAGHECSVYRTTKSLLDGLRAGTCDLLVVDAYGRRTELAETLHMCRAAASGALPILLLIDDADIFLDATVAVSADDYLVKPLRQRDLLIRVKVLLHRAWPDRHAQSLLRFGRIVVDTLAGKVTLDGSAVAFTQKEYALALLLFRHLGQPVSRATLLETIWARDADATSRTVDTHVSRVRNKLGLLAGGDYRLVPVYGYGYVLETK
jgi:DNA-binding response OmpR family regulator